MLRIKALLRLGVCLLAVLGIPATGHAKDPATATAPEFRLRDTNGAARTLSEFRGRWVVLEWVNFDCQPVKVAYRGPGRLLQQRYKSKGVVWLSVCSSARGTSGYLTPGAARQAMKKHGASPHAFLLDPTGSVGRSYGVTRTPEVRVISPTGQVVYAGAVEGPSRLEQMEFRHLHTVLAAATSGQPIPYPAKPARGCLIPYARDANGQSAQGTGPQAPVFALTDSRGVVRRLSEFRGKWVILEWVNYDCPFVKKHYNATHRNMQALQARSARAGVVWLSICSSARGKQGFLSSAQANSRMQRLAAAPTAYLHDPSGSVGRSYGARTTPDMRVINPRGQIVYAGGIDNIRSARAGDVPRAKNFIAIAIADIVARRPISVRRSPPYGCSVKY